MASAGREWGQTPSLKGSDPLVRAEADGLGAIAWRSGGTILVYAALLAWTFVALFPIFWTLSTSFKIA